MTNTGDWKNTKVRIDQFSVPSVFKSTLSLYHKISNSSIFFSAIFNISSWLESYTKEKKKYQINELLCLLILNVRVRVRVRVHLLCSSNWRITLAFTCKRVRVRYERLKFHVCLKFDTKECESLYLDAVCCYILFSSPFLSSEFKHGTNQSIAINFILIKETVDFAALLRTDFGWNVNSNDILRHRHTHTYH